MSKGADIMKKFWGASIVMIISIIFISCDKNSKVNQDEKNNLGVIEKEFEQIVEESIEDYKEEKLDLNQYSLKNGYGDTANTTFLWFEMAYSDDGYYFENERSYLSFMDKVSGKVVPLCNKAECMHYNESYYNKECNAYFDSSFHLEFLQYYDGYLYTLAYDGEGYVYLYKISEDGSSREKYMTLYKQELSGVNGMTEYRFPEICIHRGYVYYTIPFAEYPKLYRIKLGGDTNEVLFELKGERGNMYRIRPYGDFVFFQAGHFVDETMTDINAGIFAYNINNGELTMVKNNSVSTYTLVGNIMYHSDSTGIYKRDLTTNKGDKIINLDNWIGFSVDSNYVYVEQERSIVSVYNTDGEYLCEIEPLSGQRISSLHYGDENYLFAESTIGENDEQIARCTYLKISDIAEGKAKWQYSE